MFAGDRVLIAGIGRGYIFRPIPLYLYHFRGYRGYGDNLRSPLSGALSVAGMCRGYVFLGLWGQGDVSPYPRYPRKL